MTQLKGAYAQFQSDEAFERDGIWIDYGDFGVKIARAGGHNRRFSQLMDLKMKPYESALRQGRMKNKVAERLLLEVYAESVIIDWRGAPLKDAPGEHGPFLGRDGEALPLSRDNIIQVMTDLPDLFTDLREQSQKAALFRTEVAEEEAGN